MKNIKILTGVWILLFFAGCSDSEPNGETSNQNSVIPAVEAVEAQFGSLPLEERLNGVVRAQNQVDIYPRITAPVEEVYTQNGETVEKGDLSTCSEKHGDSAQDDSW